MKYESKFDVVSYLFIQIEGEISSLNTDFTQLNLSPAITTQKNPFILFSFEVDILCVAHDTGINNWPEIRVKQFYVLCGILSVCV